ncbi:MAG: tRNA lysidine(34) synthetase TilS, partial [Fusobacteriaceae bacterium]
MLIKKILNFIKMHELFQNGDKIVVGFSGGPDSVFLLEILKELKKEININFCLCHINHLLRGQDSDNDENFSYELAKKIGVEIFSLRTDVKKISCERKISLEETGREIRKKFFAETLEKFCGTKIALAHNKDDQVETFIFRLIRGTSIKGLSGIDLQKNNYVRPLLETYKKDIIDYLDKNKIKYCVDKTNLENNFTRNSIRLDLIPFIEKRYNPKFKDKIISLLNDIKEFEEEQISLDFFLEEEKILINKFEKLSKFNQKKLLNEYLIKNNLKNDRYKIISMIKLLDTGGTKKISLDKNFFLVKNYTHIYFEKINMQEKILDEIQFKTPSKINFGNFIIEAEKNSSEKEIIKNNQDIFTTNILEGTILKIRTRRHGDKIIPIG